VDTLTVFSRGRLPPAEQLVLTQGHVLLKSRQPMTITQKRLVSLGIAIQRRADIELRKPRIYTNDFARLFGLSGNSIHQTISEGTRGLLDLKVFVEMGEGSFRGYSWVTEAAYIGHRKSEVNLAYSEFAFNPALQKFLLNLEGRFQSYALLETSSITRVASWRLYEILLADTFGFGRAKTTIHYDIERLQYLLDAQGMPWRDFRRVLFERAQEDHARETGLKWTYERVTQGRKVTGVDITIVEAPQWRARPVPNEVPEGVSAEDLDLVTLKNELLEIGFTYDPTKYLKELGVEGVKAVFKQCLREKRERDQQAGVVPIRNLAGFVHERLKKSLAGTYCIPVAKEQFQGNVEAGTLTDETVLRLATSLSVALRDARREYAIDLFDTLPAEKQESIRRRMELELDPIRLDLFRSQDWDMKTVISSWATFALKLFPELFPEHLRSVSGFTDAKDLLPKLSDTDRERVLQEAEKNELGEVTLSDTADIAD
jgi:plasmid replication initiation protein